MGERLARLEAMMCDTRDDVKTIISEMREWKKVTDTQGVRLDERVSRVEAKVWYASGAAAVLAFFAGLFGKDMFTGR